MRVFALSDPHLGTRVDKPMDRFGPHWVEHPRRIAENWRAVVRPEDLVLVPGDISWAMRLEEAQADLALLGALPGTKVLLRGNHDYWWQSIGKVRSALPPGMFALQNDVVRVGPVAICGTRGWTLPGTPGYAEAVDGPLVRREAERLALSLRLLPPPAEAAQRLAIFHYPPLPVDGGASPFGAALEAAGIPLAVYGHLHRAAPPAHDVAPAADALVAAGDERPPLSGLVRGVRYVNASCDYIDFTPLFLLEA
ncbi:MAG: metallophosphoesterase [Planctomycetes bacterium]|nr:metallophosphoesterase [Planctomycetota bacterium]